MLNFCSPYQRFPAIGKWDTQNVQTWIYSYTSQNLRTLVFLNWPEATSIYAHSRWPYGSQIGSNRDFLLQRGFGIPPYPCCVTELCFHILALKAQSVWTFLTQDMVIKQHSRGLFCHLNLCNKILVTELQIVESRWLKYLTRARAFPEITLHGSGQLHPLTPWQGIHRLKTKSPTPSGDSAFTETRPPVLHLPLYLQFPAPVPDIFNNSLMNECFGKSGDCKEPIRY